MSVFSDYINILITANSSLLECIRTYFIALGLRFLLFSIQVAHIMCTRLYSFWRTVIANVYKEESRRHIIPWVQKIITIITIIICQ